MCENPGHRIMLPRLLTLHLRKGYVVPAGTLRSVNASNHPLPPSLERTK